MGQEIQIGTPPIAVVLRRSGRARRISLRVSGLDGRVTLTVPNGVREAEALAFAQEKHSWLQRQLAERVPETRIWPGTVLPVEGQDRVLRPGGGRRILLSDQALDVPGNPEDWGPRLRAWLRTRARDRLAHESDVYADKLGQRYTRITIRDTRSRWGSCSSNGALMYSWRLILAPPEVLSYVAAHEVAHLAEMNHSARFWARVKELCPEYETPRNWLRQNGSQLHRYQFD